VATIPNPHASAGVAASEIFGLALWTTPLFSCSGTLGPAAETLVLVLAQAQQSGTLTHLGTWVDAGGVTPGGGVNGLAVYSEAGILLGQTGDMTALMEGTGFVEGTISGGAAVTAGTNYYLAELADFTGTSPAIVAGPGLAAYPEVNGHYPSVVAFGMLAFPASLTPSAMTEAGTPLFMTGR
jgi:hypothetical protein